VAACLLHSKEGVMLCQVLTLNSVLSKMSEIDLLLYIRGDTYNKLLKYETILFYWRFVIGRQWLQYDDVTDSAGNNLVIKPTWCKIFLSMFMSFLYMFQATMCPSSGETTVSV